MKRTTRKLSGQVKDRYLERFIAAEPGLDAAMAKSLAARCGATFTSLRVRRVAVGLLKRRAPGPPPVAIGVPQPPRVPSAQPDVPPTPPAVAGPPIAPTEQLSSFDPYVFGLIPVYQREGRDGLLGRLASVTRVEDLRAMAKTQQVVLPAEFRSGDVAAPSVRAAIADAVAKRIADRRAAAG